MYERHVDMLVGGSLPMPKGRLLLRLWRKERLGWKIRIGLILGSRAALT